MAPPGPAVPAGPDPTVAVEALAAALPAILPRRRWYGGRARSLTGVTAVDLAPLPGTRWVLALYRADFATGGPELYLVPVDRQSAEAPGPDRPEALDDPSLPLALLDVIRESRDVAGRLGVFRGRALPTLAEALPDRGTAVRQVSGEQSHTSRVIDDRAVLKVFRRLSPGPNPELEVPAFLTQATTFRGVPRLLGALTYEAAGAESTVVAVLQEFVASRGDAFTLLRARLDAYYAAAGGRGSQPPDPARARELAAADARELRELGVITGGLHQALASAPPHSPLAPAPITSEDVEAWTTAMRGRLEKMRASLTRGLDGLAPAVRDRAREVLKEADGIREDFGGLAALAGSGVVQTRIHGDYHLGQVLRTPDSYVILDFEGEPDRPLSERRRRESPLRDVAGMVRSFSYAARAALDRAVGAATEGPSLAERLVPWADAWEEGARSAFLDGYLAETWEKGVPFLPRRRDTLDAVLRAFEIDKAVYEVQYELDHRPAWVGIPLAGLRRRAATTGRPQTARLLPGEGPFAFVACLELREFIGLRAQHERELIELMDQAPLDSIYYHTHAFFLRHKFLLGPYPNDFATWVAGAARDPVLAERLAMVDPAELPGLQALREELVAVMDDHVRREPLLAATLASQPFDFVRSRIVQIPTGVAVTSLAEFRQGLVDVDVSAIYFHLVEARMRLGRGQNDFAAWLERGLGLPQLATRFRAVSPYVGGLERTRSRLVQLCDEALGEAGTA